MLRGVATIDALIAKAKEYNMPYLALTDLNGMYGLIEFYKKCKEANIKPILGVQIDEPDDPDTYAVFIARNREGYSDICKIITSRKLKDDFSLFPLLQSWLPNVFILTSSRELLETTPVRDTIFAELIATPRWKRHTRELFEFARNRGIPYVASHPVYFIEKEDYLLHKTVTAIRELTTIDNLRENQLVDEQWYFKAPDEFRKQWKALPEALENVERIAGEANVDLKLGEIKFPKFDLPDSETAFSYLWKLCFEGLRKRYQSINEKIINRLKYEIDVIQELGFTDYFLVVWDIVSEAKRRNMVTIGRGSAANSLVSYCLFFTDVDPIKYDLYFERFLNRGRSSPPDIDIDFSWKERDNIVKYVFEKYGYDKTAMISTTITFRARSAFREVAKAFGISESEISEYSKKIPWTNAQNLPNLAELFPESRSLNFKHEPWKTIVETASKLARFPRHLSIHPGGIVITPEPITNFTALEYAKNKGLGLIITQPDMYPIEDLGLIKIDLLSQRSLGVLRDTMNVVTPQVAEPSAQSPGTNAQSPVTSHQSPEEDNSSSERLPVIYKFDGG